MFDWNQRFLKAMLSTEMRKGKISLKVNIPDCLPQSFQSTTIKYARRIDDKK